MNPVLVSRREWFSLAAAAGWEAKASAAPPAPEPRNTRSYNENMEYRRLGRTNLMISAVSMGGHWKKIPFKPGTEEFHKNRRDVVYACLDHGINYIDACTPSEVVVYSQAVRERREEIYFGFESTGARNPEIAGSLEKMKQGLDEALKKCRMDYVDLWRVTMREQTTRNSLQEIENVVAAMDWARQSGRARFTGISTHHRPWIADAVVRYPQIQVVITPYASGSREKPVGSMFDALRKTDTGFIGIKPFASGALFASRGTPESATRQEDDDRARLALRNVLRCDLLAAAIPGLITVEQVKNAAAAVKERRQLDRTEEEKNRQITAEMWRNLPPGYEWLRDWQWV